MSDPINPPTADRPSPRTDDAEERGVAAATGGLWVPPGPTRVPALHASLQASLRHPVVITGTCNAVTAGQGTIIPLAPTPLDAALILHAEEAARLRSAELFVVDPGMTRQALAAGALLPDWSVQPQDLPAENGFLVYDRPIGHSRAGDLTVPIVACSWGPAPHFSPPTGAVWLTFWSAPNRDRFLDHVDRPRLGPSPPSPAKAPAAEWDFSSDLPPLWWDDESLVCWSAGKPDIPLSPRFIATENVRGVIAKDATLPWIRTVLATWLLIAQPTIVEITQQVAPRPERRRAERAGHRLPPVRVVSIHRRARPASPTGTGVSGRTVRVRFPVRGFWRDQPYGKGRALRRRTWISEHWRGPENAPVLERPTVTVVDTPPTHAARSARPSPPGAAGRGLS